MRSAVQSISSLDKSYTKLSTRREMPFTTQNKERLMLQPAAYTSNIVVSSKQSNRESQYVIKLSLSVTI